MKKLLVFFALIFMIVSFSGCYGDVADTDLFGVGGPYPFFRKPNNWKQYSTSDYFKLSEKEVYSHSEEVEDPDGNESILKYYYRGFGTFPIMMVWVTVKLSPLNLQGNTTMEARKY